jgi:hypothetical protein
MSDTPTFLYEEPVFLVLVCPVLLVSLTALFVLARRLFGRPTRAMSALLVIWMLILVPFVPIVVLLVLSYAVIGVLTAMPWVLISPWGRRRILVPRLRSKLRAWEEAGCAPTRTRLPGDLRARARRLLADGFELVEAGAVPLNTKMMVLVRPTDGILAELARIAHFHDPSVIASLMSVADSGRTAYRTSNLGLRDAGVSTDPLLSEVYPYARPEALLEHHLVGRRLLENRGIGFASMDAALASRFCRELRRVDTEKTIDLLGRRLRGRKRLTEPRTLLEVLADPAVHERVEALRSG